MTILRRTTPRRFTQIDVFTSVPFLGNPVAVIIDGDGLDSATMQRIATWTNLSETTFVMTPDDPAADYGLRIFTPRAELPFAGHPTIGSAHAVLAAGIAHPRHGRMVQQCAVGLVEIAVPDDWRDAGVSFRLPRHAVAPAPSPRAIADALMARGTVGDGGLARAAEASVVIGEAPGGETIIGETIIGETVIVDVGPRWVVAELANGAAVRALTPDFAALAAYDRAHGTTGLTVFGIDTGGDAGGEVVVRSFAPADGINEDPVCGSGNAAVAAYRLGISTLAIGDQYVASQGREVGRDGRVAVAVNADGIHIGGQCAVCIEGVLHA